MVEARKMGKSELFAHFAERFEWKRTQAREFFEYLAELAEKELKRTGEFTLPAMVKLYVRKTKARMGRNPATGEPIKNPGQDRGQGPHPETDEGCRAASPLGASGLRVCAEPGVASASSRAVPARAVRDRPSPASPPHASYPDPAGFTPTLQPPAAVSGPRPAPGRPA